ncbi:MAG: type II secretion system minor pseudopilin GspK [Burkholderiaceae bacterium]|nr:type II secretion system minor pseudopilin GspK [Burkholderiaceae bacterium]
MNRQRGAALLAAMLTVTLVATMAAAAMWQQWRSVEVESAERARVQSAWVLLGALDWARLILREDARTGGADHLAEPWAVPLQEARLSSFLAMDSNNTDNTRDAFLSGSITDLQGKLNVTNLIDNNRLSEASVLAFSRLFDQLGVSPDQLSLLTGGLLSATRAAVKTAESNTTDDAPLLPQRVDQLTWLGLSAETVEKLKPHVTLLPERTTVNLNTADAEVIQASIPGLDRAGAMRFVTTRESSHFATLTEAAKLDPSILDPSVNGQLSVTTRFFLVRGRLRLDQAVVEESSVVKRDGLVISNLWRERGTPLPAPLR